MDPKSFIKEKDKKLWKKIKRNGNFTNIKKELIQKAKSAKGNEWNPPENSASSISPTLNCFNRVEHVTNIKQTENFAETIDERNNNYDDVDSEHEYTDDEIMQRQDMVDFREELKSWALTFQIKHVALNSLLNILKSHIPDNALPKDARTLVGTPKNTSINTDENIGGQYWHYGLRKVLKGTLAPFENIPSEISLRKKT